MKNPFYFNFLWLGSLVVLFSFVLLFSSNCGCYYFYFPERLQNILLGILSSAILLFLAELVTFIRDKMRFGFLAGNYQRLSIYQVNQERKQWIKNEIENRGGQQFEYTVDSIYHRLMVYDEQIEKLKINLKYLYFGKYIGTVDYDEGSANITLSLDTINETQGKGTYQYYQRKFGEGTDIGIYEIQVEFSQSQILLYVYYKNTIPIGAAEGYEIWKKI